MIFSKLSQLLRKIINNRFIKVQKVDHHCNFKSKFDTLLLNSLRHARIEWLDTRMSYLDNSKSDGKLLNEVVLARRKYLFLYHVARDRKIRGRLTMPMFKE